MKAIKYLFTFMLFVFSLSIGAQITNRLVVESITGAAGKESFIPVSLENNQEIVAVQFNLHLPFPMSGSSIELMSDRAKGHSVSVRSLGNNDYTIVVVSMNNEFIRGNSGTLLNVPMKVDATAQPDEVYDMTVSDVVLSDIDGKNVASESAGGKFTVQRMPSPDLIVEEVSFGDKKLIPNKVCAINWKIKNIGNDQTKSGWSEKVYLVSETTGENLYIGSTYYESLLGKGISVARSENFKLPEIIGFEGNVKVRVEVVPYVETGELRADQGNNKATSMSTAFMEKQLYINNDEKTLYEAEDKVARIKLSRSGDWSMEEVFTLKALPDNRLSVPSKVTIPQGQSAVYFNATVKANGLNDEGHVVTLTGNGNGYSECSTNIDIVDDVYPTLTITSDSIDVTEGESLVLHISVDHAPEQDLPVFLACDVYKRFRIPENIKILKGQNKVDVTVEAVDDLIPDIEQVVAFTVSATQHNDGRMLTTLLDNDIPNLQIEMVPAAISEGAGPLAVSAVIKRTNNIDKKVEIHLTDDAEGAIYYARDKVTMQAGVSEITVNLGPVDNAVVDNERTYHITAAVYISSCNCSAQPELTGGSVTAPLTIYDNDGAVLMMKASSTVLKENGQIEVTVSRNTDTSKPVVVKLSSNHDAVLEYPREVTIAAGKPSATFVVKSKGNDVKGDDFTVVITAESAGFIKGNTYFSVSDQTLPDAQITSIVLKEQDVFVKEKTKVSLVLENSGVHPLPEQTKIGIYVGKKFAEDIFLQEPLSAGGKLTLETEFVVPENVGEYSVIAVVNENHTVKELNYNNNVSDMMTLRVLPAFTAMVKTDKAIYNPGENVLISGKISGKKVVGNEAVDVYVINEGYRHIIPATSKEDGTFEVRYLPQKGLLGHFAVGACYPHEGLRKEMASFDIYGVKRINNEAIICETLAGERFDGKFTLLNPSRLPLSDFQVKVVSKPADCDVKVNVPTSVKAESSVEVSYSLYSEMPSEGDSWKEIVLNFTSKEGASYSMTIFYYCYHKTGKLITNISKIQSTMVKGGTHDYSFIITNVGNGETGNITLSLPAWMKSVTPKTMASLKKGESAEVMLRFTPTDKMKLNVPVTGSIGINCASGGGLALPYSIEPVSETTGTLSIDVCDELTYYTKEAPHIKGAKVTITHPTKGTLVASGMTDENGLYSIVLPEGFYLVQVTAEKHESYRNNLLVDPGKDNKVVVNLSYNAITIDWQVKETEVRDEYDIETTVKYETNVPVPIVESILPKRLDVESLADGESLIFNAILTNKGLITANDVALILPQNVPNLTFEALSAADNFDLSPQQSVIIPVRVTYHASEKSVLANKSTVTTRGGRVICGTETIVSYSWICGADRKFHWYKNVIQLYACRYVNDDIIAPVGPDGGTPQFPYPPKLPIFNPTPNKDVPSVLDKITKEKQDDVITVFETDGCDPCLIEYMKRIALCIGGFIPGWGCIQGLGQSAGEALTGNFNLGSTVLSGLGCLPGPLGQIATAGGCIVSLVQPCDPQAPVNLAAKSAPSTEPSFLKEFKEKGRLAKDEYMAFQNALVEYFGDYVWLEKAMVNELYALVNAVESTENTLVVEKLKAYKPEQISQLQFKLFVERMNNTRKYAETGKVSSENYVHQDKFIAELEKINAIEKHFMDMGYISTGDMWNTELEKCLDKIEKTSSSVCASVSLKFNQNMAFTRQAFRGTLTVFNGNESVAMTEARFDLKVTDQDGNVATSREFQINPESLNGFKGELDFNSGWSLDANSEGVVSILFIPTKYAAPTIDKIYYFSGSFSYIDPYTGLLVTRELSPVALTVKPAPVFDMTYFMQRNILGDDPLTNDVVEPMVPAEFSLLINNKGNGNATDVNIVTHQPQIIDNEKGLFIDFEILSSRVNGGERTLALGGSVGANFGTIPAHSSAVAQWELQSSLLGHFVDYDVKATHVSSYGNKDLSLVDEVTIHELIHSFNVPQAEGTSLIGFLVNDIVDAEDTPDMLYFSDGNICEVENIDRNHLAIASAGANKATLTVSVNKKGWCYGSVMDPTLGMSKLIKVIRKSDHKEMPLSQFWQTEYTLRDGRKPQKEYLLHYVDEMKNVNESYELYFEPYPELPLAVEAFEMEKVENNLHVKPVESVNVRFNKAIRPETFTKEDVNLICQGESVDLSALTLTSKDNCLFTLNLGNIANVDGYYVATVNTAGITDTEGFQGKSGKSVDWIYFLNGDLIVRAEAYPLVGGFVQIIDDNATSVPTSTLAAVAKDVNTDKHVVEHKVSFNKPVRLEAKPAVGYQFCGWYMDDKLLSNQPSFTTSCVDHSLLQAKFIHEYRNVTFKKDGVNGKITGVGPGKYDYGSILEFHAQPATGFGLAGWMINGNIYPADENGGLVWTLTGDIEVEALYVSTIAGSSLGDVNNDGAITVLDVILLNQFLAGQYVEGFRQENADINMDGTITVLDSAELIDIILNKK